jgi:hypothetical protein
MKKTFRIVPIVLLLSLSILSVSGQQTHFGLKAGLNLSSVAVENGIDYKTRTGIHFGGLAHIHISTHFALQPELVFSMQGGETNTSKYKLNYINVPVLAQYMTNDGFRLQTGPQIGFLTSAKIKTGNVEVTLTDSRSSVDLSWAFGASYLFPQGIGIDARYNLGLTNIVDSDDYSEKNRVFQVGLFYQFMHHAVKSKKK